MRLVQPAKVSSPMDLQVAVDGGLLQVEQFFEGIVAHLVHTLYLHCCRLVQFLKASLPMACHCRHLDGLQALAVFKGTVAYLVDSLGHLRCLQRWQSLKASLAYDGHRLWQRQMCSVAHNRQRCCADAVDGSFRPTLSFSRDFSWKSIDVDVGHRGGYPDGRQCPATVEGMVLYGRQRRRQFQSVETGAAVEGIVADDAHSSGSTTSFRLTQPLKQLRLISMAVAGRMMRSRPCS